VGQGSDTTVADARYRPVAWLGLVAGVLLAALGIALLTVVDGATRHESTAVLLIDQPAGLSVAQDAGLIDKLSRLRFKYAGLVTTATFAEQVASAAGTSAEETQEALFSTADPGSLLLHVGARHDDPLEARELAGAAAQEVVQYAAEEQAEAAVPDENRFAFQIVTPAIEGQRMPDPLDRYGIAATILGGALALASALGLMLLPRRD
jgi:hypothetical protein